MTIVMTETFMTPSLVNWMFWRGKSQLIYHQIGFCRVNKTSSSGSYVLVFIILGSVTIIIYIRKVGKSSLRTLRVSLWRITTPLIVIVSSSSWVSPTWPAVVVRPELLLILIVLILDLCLILWKLCRVVRVVCKWEEELFGCSDGYSYS